MRAGVLLAIPGCLRQRWHTGVSVCLSERGWGSAEAITATGEGRSI